MLVGLIALSVMAAWLGFGLRASSIQKVLPYVVQAAITITAVYFCLIDRHRPDWSYLLAAVVVGFALGFSLKSMLRYLNIGILDKYFSIARAKLVLDFRVYASMTGLVIAYIMTFYFAKQGVTESPAGFWFNFYVSWIAGLLLFTVVGFILGFVALYKPENDVFEARVRILVGGRSDGAVKYLSDELRKIGFAAKNVQRTIIFERYDEERNAFYLRTKHVSTLENIYQDVVTEATGTAGIIPDAFEPPLEEIGRVISCKVDGASMLTVPMKIGPQGINEKWVKNIPKGGEIIFDWEYLCWVSGKEVHEMTPTRFTGELTARFLNRCETPGKKLVVSILKNAGNSDHILPYDESYVVGDMRGIAPGTKAYSFSLRLD